MTRLLELEGTPFPTETKLSSSYRPIEHLHSFRVLHPSKNPL